MGSARATGGAEDPRGGPRGNAQGDAPRGSQRVLRVLIVLGDSPVEERIIRERQTVSIGQSIQNTFSVPISGLPLKWPLFVVEDGRYALHLTERMDLRLSEASEHEHTRTLEGLAEEGKAAWRDDRWVIPLGEKSRGKVTQGKLTILFQLVKPPPVQPRPKLPAAVRGTFADRIDPRLAVIVGVSLALHLGLAWWGSTRELDRLSRVEQLAEDMGEEYEARAVDAEFDIPQEPEAEVDPDIGEPDDDEIAEAPGEADDDPAPDPGDPAEGAGQPDPGEIRDQIEDAAFLSIATGDEGEGGRYDDMRETDYGAALEETIESVREGGGEVVAGGSPAGGSTRGPDEGEIGTGSGGPGVDGPGEEDQIGSEPEEEEIPSRADFESGGEALVDTTLDPNEVAQRIRNRYLAGIQRCHERVLRQNPNAGGRVELDFTVGEGGRVVRADVFGFNSIVDDCIEGLTRNWRFGVPRDNAGNPTEADFVFPLVLEPGG